LDEILLDFISGFVVEQPEESWRQAPDAGLIGMAGFQILQPAFIKVMLRTIGLGAGLAPCLPVAQFSSTE